ncbi:MAG TPA: hypothetical protein VMU11_02660 [Verrucomicrobiae bacterium]|nr:hypothetical protein [Verrucomicrobiae bacterium]
MKRIFSLIARILGAGLVTGISLTLSASAALASSAGLSAPAEVQVGHTFQVKLLVGGAKDVDTVRFIGSYPTDLITYQGSANGSSLPTRSPGSSAGGGSFNFGGFSLGSPVNGGIQAGTLTFRADKIGTATISLGSGTRILSDGVDQLTSMGSVKVNIVAAPPAGTIPVTPPAETVVTLTSDSHPNPDVWYASRNVSVSWNITGKTPVQTTIGFDQAPEGPAESKRADNGSTTFLAPSDGVWYAHLVVRFSSTDIVRKDLRVQIDTTPPHQFAVVTDYTDVNPDVPNVLRFAALDDESGIARYDVSLNGDFLASTSDTALTLGKLAAGDYSVSVRATDYAGNASEANSSFRILTKVQTPTVPYSESTRDVVVRWISILLICLLLFVFGWFVGRAMKQKTKKRTRK